MILVNDSLTLISIFDDFDGFLVVVGAIDILISVLAVGLVALPLILILLHLILYLVFLELHGQEALAGLWMF